MLKRRGAHFRPVPERRCRSRLTLEAAGGGRQAPEPLVAHPLACNRVQHRSRPARPRVRPLRLSASGDGGTWMT